MKLSVGVLFASSSCLSMANAFFVIRVTSPHQAKTRSRAERQFLLRSTPPEASTKVDDYDVTCYIVNEEEIITDGEDPHVVCTAEPEEVRHPHVYLYFTFAYWKSNYILMRFARFSMHGIMELIQR